ncbi:MAG: ankyrin repeat domain-containing protein [Puniceicoccales bacterium]|nr:ankyrin repeat domain-containing protein [Puniceicoccales bacterium]
MEKNILKIRSLFSWGGLLVALTPNLALGYTMDYSYSVGHPDNMGHPNNAAYPRTTPLHRAVIAQNLNAVHDALIVDTHAANRKITNGMTALHLAVLVNNFPIIEELIRGGADPCICDNVGDTPLHIAARTRNSPIVRYLLQQSADPNAPDDEWRTPLHWAAWNNNLDMVQILTDYGADPTLTTRTGWCARDFSRRRDVRNFLTELMQ